MHGTKVEDPTHLKDVSPLRPIGLVMRRKNNAMVLFASGEFGPHAGAPNDTDHWLLGLLFAFGFLVPYTSARTLSAFYHFEALKIGLVTLSYGFGMLANSKSMSPADVSILGSIAGSLLGGRWSDYELARLKRKNNGVGKPEVSQRTLNVLSSITDIDFQMRLHSITIGAILLPPFTIALGWICKQHVHVSAICVFLFCCGFLSM